MLLVFVAILIAVPFTVMQLFILTKKKRVAKIYAQLIISVGRKYLLISFILRVFKVWERYKPIGVWILFKLPMYIVVLTYAVALFLWRITLFISAVSEK